MMKQLLFHRISDSDVVNMVKSRQCKDDNICFSLVCSTSLIVDSEKLQLFVPNTMSSGSDNNNTLANLSLTFMIYFQTLNTLQ